MTYLIIIISTLGMGPGYLTTNRAEIYSPREVQRHYEKKGN